MKNTKTKYRFQGILIGFVAGLIITFGVPAFAAGIVRTIDVALNAVSFKVNGVMLDAPNFVYDGRTYVQAMALCDMLNKDITWDGENHMVIINDISTEPVEQPSTEVPPTTTEQAITTEQSITTNNQTLNTSESASPPATLTTPPPGNGSTTPFPEGGTIPAPIPTDDDAPLHQ